MKRNFICLVLAGFLKTYVFAQSNNLKDCINTTFSNSTAVKTAEENLLQAELNEKLYQAPFYPALKAYFSDTLAGYDNNGNLIKVPTITSDTYTMTLNLTYNFFNMGKDIDKLNYYTARKEESMINLENIKQQVALKVINSYYSLLKAEKSLKIKEENLRQKKERLKLTESLFKAGIRSKSDYLNAEIQIGNSEIAVIEASNQVVNAKADLNVNMGASPNGELDIVDDLEFIKYDLTYEKCLDVAFAKRYDLQKLIKQRQQSEISLILAEKDLYPSISIDGSYSLSLDNYFRGSDTWTHKGNWDQNASWGVTFTLSYPIFNSGLNYIKADIARLDLLVVKLAEVQLKRDIQQEVFKSWNNIHRIFSTIDIYKTQVEKAKESLTIIENRYKGGTSSFLDLVDAEVSYTQTQIGYFQTIYDFKIQKANLDAAMGEKLY